MQQLNVKTIAQKASQIFYKACKIGQYLLMVIFYSLLISLSYLYLNLLTKLNLQISYQIILIIIGIWISFNTLFNYTMCLLVNAGNPKDISIIQLSYLQKLNVRCKKCYNLKPARTHHCSMCNACVLQMDHHCPWIGKCVGHHNRSYFLNFLNYTLLALIILKFIIDEYMEKQINQRSPEIQKLSGVLLYQTYIFVMTLMIILILFCVFHWYLAITGKTTLQFCLNDQRYNPSNKWMDNLQIIFGTRNILIMFLPQLTPIKIKGYQWDSLLLIKNPSLYQNCPNQQFKQLQFSQKSQILT